MSLTNDRWLKHELPQLLIELGNAIDRLPARDEGCDAVDILITVELDEECAAAVKGDVKRIRERLREAALTHLVFRGREGDRVRTELFDAGSALPTLFAVTAAVDPRDDVERSERGVNASDTNATSDEMQRSRASTESFQ